MSKNEITGDEIKSKLNTKEFEKNFELIFGKKCIKNGKEEALLNAQTVSQQKERNENPAS